MRSFARTAGVASMFLLAVAVPAGAALAPPLAALASIEGGRWQLRGIGDGVASRSLCLGDPTALLQLRHPGTACSRFVIENGATVATVHYTCPGAGHGRTSIRVETPRLIRLETQGIADNAPFDLEYEGRRVGPCS